MSLLYVDRDLEKLFTEKPKAGQRAYFVGFFGELCSMEVVEDEHGTPSLTSPKWVGTIQFEEGAWRLVGLGNLAAVSKLNLVK